jgi:hypothetical protein
MISVLDEIMRADEEQWQRLMEDKEQLDAELRLLKCQEVRRLDISLHCRC